MTSSRSGLPATDCALPQGAYQRAPAMRLPRFVVIRVDSWANSGSGFRLRACRGKDSGRKKR